MAANKGFGSAAFLNNCLFLRKRFHARMYPSTCAICATRNSAFRQSVLSSASVCRAGVKAKGMAGGGELARRAPEGAGRFGVLGFHDFYLSTEAIATKAFTLAAYFSPATGERGKCLLATVRHCIILSSSGGVAVETEETGRR